MRFAVRASLAFAVAMLVAVPGVLAQRGGGHAGGGGRSFGGGSFPGRGFSGGSFGRGSFGHSYGAFSAAPRNLGSGMPRIVPFSGSASSWGQPHISLPASAGFRSPYFGRRPYASYQRSHPMNRYGDHHRDGHSRSRYRSPYRGYGGYGVPYVYSSSVWLAPWELGYPGFEGYTDGEGDDSGAAAQTTTDQNYAAEPSGYPDQNEAREEYVPEGAASRPNYPSSYGNPPPPVAAPSPEPELTVIFRDGHTQQIRNYALTPTTLIVLDQAASGRQQRIALDQVDVAATERSARDAGLDFHPPSA